MRYLLLILISAWLRGPSALAAEPRPLVRPVGLSEVGVKLWQTLIEGNPQWSNWIELMDHEPLDHEARAQLQRITVAVHEQVGDQRQPMFRAAAGRIVRAIETDPRFLSLGLDLSNPAQAVRDSYARLTQGLPKEIETPYPVAHLKALNEIRTKYRIVGNQRLDDDQEHELADLTWTYAQRPYPRSAFPSRAEFERWKAAYEAEQDRLTEDASMRILRATLRDPDEFNRIQYVMIDRRLDGPVVGKLSDRFAIDDLPDFRPIAEMPPEFAALGEWQKVDELMLYAQVSPDVVIGLAHDNFLYSSTEGDVRDVYDLARVRTYRRYGYAITMSTLRGRYFAHAVRDGLTYAGARTKELIDRVTARSTGEPYYFVDDADWMFEIFTQLKWRDDCDFVFQMLPHARKTIYAWQIASKGFAYWGDLVAKSETSRLPKIKVLGSYPDDYYDENGLPLPDSLPGYPAAPPPAVDLLASAIVRGNHHIDDVDEKTIAFKLTRGFLPWGIGSFRLPVIENVDGLAAGRLSSGKPKFALATANDEGRAVVRTRNGHSVLLIPNPPGFAPTLASTLSVGRWFGRRTLPLADLEVRHDPARGLYAIDLGDHRIKHVDAVIAYAVDESRSETPSSPSLAFTRAQLEPVVEYLRTVGALPLADALELAGAVDARQLVKLLRRFSEYSLTERKLGHAGFRDFVGANGTFRVQCAMAAEILKTLLTMALVDHPLRNRVRMEISVVMPLRRSLFRRPSLTTPLHAQVDLLIDGRVAEVLDATPSDLEDVVVWIDGPRAGGPSIALPDESDLMLARAIAQLRAAVTGLNGPPPDRSIPTFELLHAAEVLRRTRGDLTRLKRMEDWAAQLDRLAIYRGETTSKVHGERAGADVLLSGPAVSAAHRVVEASRAVLTSACAKALGSNLN